MEINRANQVFSQSQTKQADQHTLVKELNAAKPEVVNPTSQAQVTFSVDHGISAEISKRLDEEVSQRTKKYIADMANTQAALSTSVDEFASFKAAQQAKTPQLDLSQLDLYQQKDGTLKLTGANLSASQLTELEQQIAGNQKLVDAFTELHDGIANGLKHRDSVGYGDLRANDLRGSLRLNELTERYSNQFRPDGFGQDYTTMSEQLNADTGLFAHFLLASVNPKIDTRV